MFLVPLSRRVVSRPQTIDRLFDDAFDRMLASPFARIARVDDSAPARRPAVDVTESDTAYVIALDVPGVRKDDVQVSVEGRRVSIVAETSLSPEPAAKDSAATQAPAAEAPPKPDAGRTLVRERLYARYARSLTLPADIEQGSAEARLENGVLTVTLPKRAASVARLTVN